MRTKALFQLCACLFLLAVGSNGMPSSTSQDAENDGDQLSDDNNEINSANDINDNGENKAIISDTLDPVAADDAAETVNVVEPNNVTTTTTAAAAATAVTRAPNVDDGDGEAPSLAEYFVGLLKGKPKPSNASTEPENVEATPEASTSAHEPPAENAMSADAAKPESTPAEAAKPESTPAEAAKPESTPAEASKPEFTSADAAMPKSTSAEATMPISTSAEATMPESSDQGAALFDDYGDDWSKEWEFDDYKNDEDNDYTTDYEDFAGAQRTDPCATKVDLNNYCIVDADVKDWFKQGDLSIRGLQSSIFDMESVRDLIDNCPSRGEWCLYVDLDFRQVKHRLEDLNALCLETMWECLLKVFLMRMDCFDQDTEQFRFFVDAAELMCDLTQKSDLLHNEVCLMEVVTALHVMYADFLATNMTFPEPEVNVSCGGPASKIMKNFMCYGQCNDFNVTEELRAFIAKKYNQPDCYLVCNDWPALSDNYTDYGSEENNDYDSDESKDYESDESDDYDEDEDEDDDYYNYTENDSGSDGDEENEWSDFTNTNADVEATTTYTTTQSYYPDSLNHNSQDESAQEAEDKSLMLALCVATVVGVMFIVLGFVYWRKNRHRNLYYSHGDGYNRLIDDTGPLLPKTFSE